MKLKFFITRKNRISTFETVADLESYLLRHKKDLKGSFVILKDEAGNVTGKISVSTYLKFMKDAESCSKES